MKTLLAVALSFAPTVGICDSADEDPVRLCALLQPYGLVLTEYVRVADEGRPLCFVTDQPTSITEDGYEFSYRVISPGFNRHMIVDGLGIQLIAKDYSQYVASITMGFSIRVNISNTCHFHGRSELQAESGPAAYRPNSSTSRPFREMGLVMRSNRSLNRR